MCTDLHSCTFCVQRCAKVHELCIHWNHRHLWVWCAKTCIYNCEYTIGDLDNIFKTICAQICTSERFVFKDAQKCTICAFIKIIKIYEFGVLKYVFRIFNMQLGPWITCLKPFVHRFALVHVLGSKNAQKCTICAFIEIIKI